MLGRRGFCLADTLAMLMLWCFLMALMIPFCSGCKVAVVDKLNKVLSQDKIIMEWHD